MNRENLRALVPGSFDPPTRGHAEILRQACLVFGEVVVGVAVNPEKAMFLRLEDRIRLLSCLAGTFENARVVTYEGLTASFAAKERIPFIVRGLRDERDLSYEKELARGNETLGGIKTLFFLATGTHAFVSSRLVREIVRLGGVEAALPFLPDEIHATFRGIMKGHQIHE
jgi:pantetheine-phosphate adenylyltransferase